MTIAVGAKFAGGVILGADSRLTTGKTHADGYSKLYQVPLKRFAFAVAGDLQLVTPVSNQPILDLPHFLLAHLDSSKGNRADAVRRCFTQQKTIADLVGYSDLSQQVLVVWDSGSGLEFWKLSDLYRAGILLQVNESVSTPVVGIGQFITFKTFQNDKSKVDAITRQRLEALPKPPSLPNQIFASEQEATAWVSECIAWCCNGGFDDCGGQSNIVAMT